MSWKPKAFPGGAEVNRGYGAGGSWSRWHQGHLNAAGSSLADPSTYFSLRVLLGWHASCPPQYGGLSFQESPGQVSRDPVSPLGPEGPDLSRRLGCVLRIQTASPRPGALSNPLPGSWTSSFFLTTFSPRSCLVTCHPPIRNVFLPRPTQRPHPSKDSCSHS